MSDFYPIVLSEIRVKMRWCFAGVACLGLLLVPALMGQDLSAEASSEAVEENSESGEEVFWLPAFLVDGSEDNRYAVQNAISGTRLNTAIQDLPMSLSVVNSQFIQDTGAIDFDEALSYQAGVFTNLNTGQVGLRRSSGSFGQGAIGESSPSASANVGSILNNSAVIRGLGVPFQNREGFRIGFSIPSFGVTIGTAIDAVNIDRIEVVKGPQAILYGLGVLSGISNVVTKRPRNTASTEASMGFGTEDYRRLTLDHSGPISTGGRFGTLNYRVAGALQEKGSESDYFDESLSYYVGQVEYRPWRRANLFVELQSTTREISGLGQQFITDSFTDAVWPDTRNQYNELGIWGPDYNPQSPDSGGDFAGWDRHARISGPDTEFYMEEFTALVDFTMEPLDGLTLRAAAFYADQSNEEFDVEARIFNNALPNGQISERSTTILEKYRPFYYLGQNAVGLNEAGVPIDANGERVVTVRRDGNVDDHKLIGYWWTKRPQDAVTEQLRLEANYEIEKDLGGLGASRHNFLLGYSSTEDVIDFWQGVESPLSETQGKFGSIDTSISDADWDPNTDGDAFYVRAWDDYSVFRYNGEDLARPGNNYLTAKLWFSAYYGVYQGRFLDERLNVILGARRDRFDAWEGYWVRPNRENRFIEYSFRGGARGDLDGSKFEDPDERTSYQFAASFALAEDLNVYYMHGEGVSQNVGVNDGVNLPLDPEQSASDELGVKFRLLDGKVSGSVSVYRIDRENASIYWPDAPAPNQWYYREEDGVDGNGWAETYNATKNLEGLSSRYYGVDLSYFKGDDVDFDGDGTPDTDRLLLIRGPVVRAPRDPSVSASDIQYNPQWVPWDGAYSFIPEIKVQQMVFINYEKLRELSDIENPDPANNLWDAYRVILERAFADAYTRSQVTGDIYPFTYDRSTRASPSTTSFFTGGGANVTFADRTEGVDLDLTFNITPDFQVLFGYSHVERENISGFNLVPAVSLTELGMEAATVLGTEYDIWVRDLRRENFSDTDYSDGLDPTTATGGQVVGKTFYTGSEDSAKIWGLYSFRGDLLDGLDFGFGVKYNGPRRTSIDLVGRELLENLYPTPDIEEEILFDAAIIYTRMIGEVKARFAINLYNLFDDDELITEATYPDPVNTGEVIRRRSVVYKTGFQARLSVNLQF